MIVKNLMVLVGVSLLSTAALAQTANTSNANSTGAVTLIRPITIVNTAGLQFGRIVKPRADSATITIANTADAVETGTAFALPGITISRAKFTISGEAQQAININVPATFTMSNTQGAGSLVVTLTPDQFSNVLLSGTYPAAGTLTLNVGGNFSLPSTQDTGVYAGTFNVEVNYQ